MTSSRLWIALTAAASSILAVAPAEGNSRLLNRLMNRSVAKVLFEGEFALARELVAERVSGGVIHDFRVSPEAFAFRRSFALDAPRVDTRGIRELTGEEQQLAEAMTRIESRFIRLLRAGRQLDELAVLRRLSQQEIDARLFQRASGTAPIRFVGGPKHADLGEFFTRLDSEALEVVNRLGSGKSLDGAVLPGADLTLLGTRQARLWSGISARGADLRFSNAEILGSDSTGMFRGIDARPLDGKATNMSFMNASHSSLVHAQMQDVIAVGAEFRSIEAPGAIWDRIDVRFADLRGADLAGLRSWSDARWEGAVFNESTRLPPGMSHTAAVEKYGMVFEDSILGRRR